ncbi:60 kDa SS-A/Ro ribonucleoprotein-like [Copidosoma floridanum]|uniref:60 kDa SS-A/Ro ribonucleoprotein-like n=1 Tax=Copidosoma floridanum TaxID=29053 RepID=UPI0006C945AF|nr:60 kDa SS-A/Ro ribonucleoprotein-like [Copidosoma floridanum]XP_014204460.1 60 kDa SS-A/Ro ribonucleoprotein-like [Copidosoma floridanum]
MPDLNDTSALETRLRRFLYIGKESRPEYQPGNWFVHNYYDVKNIPSINELASNPDKVGPLIFLIHEAYTRGLVQNTETLIFALAMSARQEISLELKEKAYSAMGYICKTPDNFILFNKFTSQLSKKINNKSGWGHGLRRAIKTWYDKKTARELAEIICKGLSRYGWKHKDIIRLTHYKPEDENKMFVVDYILRGMNGIKSKYQQLNEEQTSLMQYFQSIEDFKHCEDPVVAGRLIETLNLTLDHVPGHLLTASDIWESLVNAMSIKDLLKYLQRIHNLKFLEPDRTVMISKVLDVLSEQNFLKEKPIHPAIFLVCLKDYENCGKPLSYEKRKVRENAKTPFQPPPAPNKKVMDALTKLLNLSFAHLQESETNVHYMITINMSKTVIESGCWHCGNVTVAEAGCLIALALLRAEKNVTVATFVNDEIKCVELDPNLNFLQAMNHLKKFESNTDVVDLSKPMTWAADKKQSIDVFINVVNQTYQKSDTSEAGIKSYRTKMGQPNTKLVNCAMCASSTQSKNTYDNHILTICGFDEKVPKIIEAFARSFF